MQTRRARKWLPAGLIVGLLMLIVPLQEAIHKTRPSLFDPDRRDKRVSAISIGPTPAVIAALGGFRTVAADLLWLKAENVWHGGSWWAMLPLLDAVTQLDPHFLLAWKVYGWHAAYNLHAESETLVDKRFWLRRGIENLERAVEANPDTWEMYFELGWTLYDRAHENWRAAQYFRQAAELPDAPHYVTRMCYRCYEHVMDFENLFPALEWALSRHKDVALHQRIVSRDLEWWTNNWDDPKEHRRQIVLENTARKQRSVPYYMYVDDPYWDVCPICGLPSPKGSEVCENPLCGYPLKEGAEAGRRPLQPSAG
jgi:tetratricopeptide (TPR) repeat protein